jgi:hypothetical protein
MAPPAKRKLQKEDNASTILDESDDVAGSVLRPSKRVNTTTLAAVHNVSRVGFSRLLLDENAPWELKTINKEVNKSDTQRHSPGTVPGGAGVSDFKNTQSIADAKDLFVPHIHNTSIGTVTGNATLSSLDSTQSNTGAVVSFAAPSTTTGSFDTIPEELVVDIFNLLRGDSASFFNISLVNKRCRRIALEPLYSKFSSQKILLHAGFHVSAGRAFVRSIVNCVDLAQKVQSLTWAYNVNIATEDRDKTLHKYLPDEKEEIALRSYLSRLQLPEYQRSMWMNKLQYAHREVNQLAITMLRCPNLRELEVNDETTYPTYQAHDLVWLQLLKDAAGGTPKGLSPMFEHLRSIDISTKGSPFRLATLSCVLRLPSLRRFLLSGAVESSPVPAPGWDCPDSASGVEDLVLHQCFFDSRVVSKLLSSCKAIKHFEYSYDSADWEPLSSSISASTWAQHSWNIIRAGLEKHQNTLEILKLEDNSDPEIVDIMRLFVLDYGHLGSLREFPRLREIEAPITALTSFDVGTSDGGPHSRGYLASNLPRGLRTVKLIFDDPTGILADYTIPMDSLKNGLLDGTLPDLRQVCVYVNEDEETALLNRDLTRPAQALMKEGIDVEVLWGTNCISLE